MKPHAKYLSVAALVGIAMGFASSGHAAYDTRPISLTTPTHSDFSGLQQQAGIYFNFGPGGGMYCWFSRAPYMGSGGSLRVSKEELFCIPWI